MKSTLIDHMSQRPLEPAPFLVEFDETINKTKIFFVLLVITENKDSSLSGVVVYSTSEEHYPVGYYSTVWDKTIFKRFSGKVVLQNNE
jgi:hypothetical protein